MTSLFIVTARRITPLGKRLVAPEAEGEDLAARREAIVKPRLLNEFFEKYRRAKLPNDLIAGNVLKGMGLPPDRVGTALEIIKDNGRYAGIIRETPTGPFINLDSPGVPAPAATPEFPEQSTLDGVEIGGADEPSKVPPATPDITTALNSATLATKANRVFISHGKQKAIVTQIKELLAFGNFEPVVSVERETTAIPVPEKVFEDMRSCGAGVILTIRALPLHRPAITGLQILLLSVDICLVAVFHWKRRYRMLGVISIGIVSWAIASFVLSISE